jgi:hypothetical protein
MQSSPPPTPRPAPRLSRQAKIGLGLALSLVGLFLISALLPTAPDKLAFGIGVAAAGVVSIWLGGVLMGIGSRS